MVAIAIQNLSKEFPGVGGASAQTRAVDAVSLQIPSGQLFFLLGPSGCGKTTLLRMIAGFTLPTAGSILFDSHDISRIPPYQRDTGMVFQSYALWPHMTVAANVGFGLDVRHLKKPDRAQRIDEALTLVQMQHLKDRKPNQLSGGQQQRVALARALAIRPKCLLLDEPLSNLDAKLRLDMRAEIRRIVKQTGITTLYVTHDQKEALSMADGIAILRDGKLQQTGAPADLYRRPLSRFVADFIGESNFLPATVESITSSAITVKTPVGPLMAIPPRGIPNLTPGRRLLAAFRPESVAFTSPAPTANRLIGRCTTTTYLGEMAEHLIDLAPNLHIKAFEINPRQPLLQKVQINLFISPDNIMLVDDA